MAAGAGNAAARSPAASEPGQHQFTLKERPLRRAGLAEFTSLARVAARHNRADAGTPERWRRFAYAELAGHERLGLNLRWLRDAAATGPAALPHPGRGRRGHRR